ncbi:hypothetical protein NPIL_666001 [Nephila pilipes]|uniref:Gustatory receptor n=1 Tax=Nephila pilipes TaxID=299642 RepID=A0A8X6TZS2_NEPPI|nr:hypothetical protein NPIL_666001 [Nephila pilipes]
MAIEYEALLCSYAEIKSIIDKIDKEVSLLIFLTIAYNSFGILFSIYFVSVPDEFDSYHIITNTAYSLICCGLYIGTTVLASKIPEASAEISLKAWIMPRENKIDSSISQQRFIAFAENEISLTLWRMIPITRNFIFSAVGIALTYTITYYTLISCRNT